MGQNIDHKDTLIYALDAEGIEDAKKWIEKLQGSVNIFKIGFQLFLRGGPEVVDLVHESGAKVFLDLKFHDIPYTVGKAAKEAVRMGVHMFNVHGSGGYDMMKQAALLANEEAGKLGVDPPIILAVTMLTSLDEAATKQIGYSLPPDEMVVRLCKLAKESGLSGVVSSPREASKIREAAGDDFYIVCPGIRSADAKPDDQSRTSTPYDAIWGGASHIVVGRPIRDAKDPKQAAKSIIEEIKKAKKDMDK
jgi:orotidine-5'-phosphate decarboxylase